MDLLFQLWDLIIVTLPETNSEFAPGNRWLEDYFPFGMAYFQMLCSFQGVYHFVGWLIFQAHWLVHQN